MGIYIYTYVMGIDVYIDIMVNGLLKVTWGLNRQIDLNGDNGRLLGCIYIYITILGMCLGSQNHPTRIGMHRMNRGSPYSWGI